MILIHGGRVLRPGSFAVEALDIVVDGDTIADLVAPGTVKNESAQRVDARDRVIIPGLVNGHTHAQNGLAKGLFDRYTLELYLNAVPWATGRRTVEDKYLSAAICAAEMVRKGCTAAFDMFADFPMPTVEGVGAVARAYADVGMRASVAMMSADRTMFEAIPGLADFLPPRLRETALKAKLAPHQEALAACRRVLESWGFDRERIRPALGPTIPHHCSDEFLAGCRDLAREFAVGTQMHVGESKPQAIVAGMRYGKTLVAHLDALGMLVPGFCVAHGVWLDDDDRARLADRGASISHNPGSNLKLGSGIADMRRMLDAGLNVAIGTDGVCSSDNLNAFEAMRLASYLSRVQDHPVERWVTSREALHAATEGGARALGFEKIGRIERGYKADLVLLDLGALHYVPLNDVVNQIVFCEDGTGVDSVMIGGRMVLDRGRLTTVDLARLRAQAEEAVARLAAANAEQKALSEKLEPYVGQYCSGLAARPYHVHRFCSPPPAGG
ncbi:MAG TPA: amidohydrolase family protein [Burkholderiales bacterium]|nr:amidohydrolase family protein [Burkholderiales bacterium]